MNKVFQTIIDKDHGNCMAASVCSLLNLNIKNIPDFFDETKYSFQEHFENILYENNCKLQTVLWNPKQSYLSFPMQSCFEKIYFHEPALLHNLSNYKGIDGYFIASVLSPKYFNFQDGMHQTHAVICNKNFEIVHDPNPNNHGLLEYPLARLIDYNGILSIYIIERM